MKKSINKFSFVLLFVFISLIFIAPSKVDALNYKSEYIKITDVSYTHSDEELSISQVYFSKSTNHLGDVTSYGTLFGKMVNLSDYYLSAYMTIDYYDANYNIIARSTKTEQPSGAEKNYMMNIILYDNDFLGESSINDIEYFKVNYYTVKGNPLPNSNNTNNNNESYIPDSSIKPSDNYGYTLNSYDINIIVNENNTLNITEKIGAYFNVEKHGIFRKIPLRNEITRLDGTTSKIVLK